MQQPDTTQPSWAAIGVLFVVTDGCAVAVAVGNWQVRALGVLGLAAVVVGLIGTGSAMAAEAANRFVIYYLRDSEGRLIYVGQTNNWPRRLTQHMDPAQRGDDAWKALIDRELSGPVRYCWGPRSLTRIERRRIRTLAYANRRIKNVHLVNNDQHAKPPEHFHPWLEVWAKVYEVESRVFPARRWHDRRRRAASPVAAGTSGVVSEALPPVVDPRPLLEGEEVGDEGESEDESEPSGHWDGEGAGLLSDSVPPFRGVTRSGRVRLDTGQCRVVRRRLHAARSATAYDSAEADDLTPAEDIYTDLSEPDDEYGVESPEVANVDGELGLPETARRLRAEGMSVRGIASELQVPKSTVYDWLRGA